MIKINKFVLIPSLAAFLFTFASCVGNEDEDDDEEYGIHSISEIYGYTYEGTVNASSGNKLTPEITLYNENRLDWNMSSTGMANNQFYYCAEPYKKYGIAFPNVYITYWYTSETVMNADTKRTSAAMKVFLAINTLKNITVEVESAGTTGAGNSMAGTPIDMTRNSDFKNITPTTISSDENNEDIKDEEIEVLGNPAEWFESSSTYEGTFTYLVSEDGSVGKGEGTSGEGYTPQVVIAKTANNTVTVKTPRMVYGGTMTVEPYDVSGVSVTKDGEIYYLSKGEFSSNDGNYAISGTSLTGKLENGILTLKVVFQPGSMPFPITQIFTSN